MDVISEYAEDFAAWVVCRRVQKKSGKKGKGEREPRKGKGKANGGLSDASWLKQAYGASEPMQ